MDQPARIYGAISSPTAMHNQNNTLSCSDTSVHGLQEWQQMKELLSTIYSNNFFSAANGLSVQRCPTHVPHCSPALEEECLKLKGPKVL